MKAYKYKVTISIDAVHSWSDREIDEIWIPEYNICFNSENGCFETDKPRNEKYEKFEFDDEDDAITLAEFVDSREEVEDICNKYFKKEKDNEKEGK